MFSSSPELLAALLTDVTVPNVFAMTTGMKKLVLPNGVPGSPVLSVRTDGF
jgi:hypothetical protein